VEPKRPAEEVFDLLGGSGKALSEETMTSLSVTRAALLAQRSADRGGEIQRWERDAIAGFPA
jgi:hypothetical protein